MALFKRHEFSQNSITEGVIWKNLLAFFFPILLGTFFQQLYNTADAVIVGNFVGTEALAAVGGTTGTLVNLVVGFFVGAFLRRDGDPLPVLRRAAGPRGSARRCIPQRRWRWRAARCLR